MAGRKDFQLINVKERQKKGDKYVPKSGIVHVLDFKVRIWMLFLRLIVFRFASIFKFV